VRHRGRVPESVGIHGEPEATPHDRAPTLEFRDREEHTLTEERVECALQALSGDKALEVPVLAARTLEKHTVGAWRVRVHDAAGERQEIGGSVGMSAAENHPGLGRSDRGSEEGRESGEEPQAEE
jgi:hypothetical protein